MSRLTSRSTGLPRRVAERDVVEQDVARDRRQLDRVGPLGHARMCGEQLLQLVDGRLPRLVGGVELHELLDRREERGEVEHERGELADRERAVQHHVAADEQDHRLARCSDELGARAVDRASTCAVYSLALAVLADDVAVLLHVVAPPVVRGDDPDARQALLQVGEHVGDAVAHHGVAAVGRAAEPDRQRSSSQARRAAR